VWDLATGEARVLPHRNRVDCVAYTPDGTLLTGGWDGRVLAWDASASSARPVAPLLPHEGQLYALAVSPDGETIVTAGQERVVRVWERVPRKPHARWRVGTTQPVSVMALSPPGDRLFAREAGNSRLFDSQSGRELWKVPRGRAGITAAFSPDGATLALASEKSVRLLDARTGDPLGVLRPHEKPLRAVALGPGAATVLTGSADQTARLSDALTGTPVSIFRRGHNGPVTAAAMSPDGSAVLTGGLDGVGRLWEVGTGTPLGPPLRHPGGVLVVAWSEDGQVVLTGGWTETRLWTRSGTLLVRPLTHPSPIRAARFSPNGKAVVTGHGDGAVRLWDVATGRPLAAPFRHAKTILAVGFGRDGRVIAGTEDGAVSHWEVPRASGEDPVRVALWAEVLTGMELDASVNAPHLLGPDEWLARRKRLHEGDGPPRLVPAGR
jgi:WD40 repeat protein